MALAKGFPALALMSESDLEEDFGPFAAALKGALDPIVADFRRQMVSAFIGDLNMGRFAYCYCGIR